MGEMNIIHFENSEDAGRKLARILKEGDVALIKGSQSTRMERAVKSVLEEPDLAQKKLVRQDRVWLKR